MDALFPGLNLTTALLGGDTQCVVLVGANGSGKSQRVASLARAAKAPTYLAAQRRLEIPDALPAMDTHTMRARLSEADRIAAAKPWKQTDSLYAVLGLLIDDDEQYSVQFRRLLREAAPGTLPTTDTRLDRLVALWNDLLPGRVIMQERDRFQVIPQPTAGPLYPASHLSDGERAVLFAVARVLFAPKGGPIIVDEPEMHLHPLLARDLWDRLEDERDDCRFIYATHDLYFALSRRSARFLACRRGEEPEEVPVHRFGARLAPAILGAACFSAPSSRIVFCEGAECSIDLSLYGAWFAHSSTHVVPAGSCLSVDLAVKATDRLPMFAGQRIIGVVDQDYGAKRTPGDIDLRIHCLPVREAECLLCLPAVFETVANSQHIAQPAQQYSNALLAAREQCCRTRVDELIVERAKALATDQIAHDIHECRSRGTRDDIERSFLAAGEQASQTIAEAWTLAVGEIEAALAPDGSPEDFLRVAPGKQTLDHFAKALSFRDRDAYVRFVSEELRERNSKHESSTGNQLAAALEGALPDPDLDDTR